MFAVQSADLCTGVGTRQPCRADHDFRAGLDRDYRLVLVWRDDGRPAVLGLCADFLRDADQPLAVVPRTAAVSGSKLALSASKYHKL